MKWPKNKSPWILMKLWDLLEVGLTKTVQKFGQKNPSGSASSGLETVLIFIYTNPLGLSHILRVFYGFLRVFYGFLGYFRGS